MLHIRKQSTRRQIKWLAAKKAEKYKEQTVQTLNMSVRCFPWMEKSIQWFIQASVLQIIKKHLYNCDFLSHNSEFFANNSEKNKYLHFEI